MRKVILQMGLSIDGIVAGGPDEGGPGAPEHPEVVARKLDRLRTIGTHVMGRVTYQQMAAHWPTATHEYAALMNDGPTGVFSTTLATAEWPTTRIARGDLADEIAQLKAEPGGDIMAHGGAAFVQALSRARLIDQYHLVIRPVALGAGQPMFKDLPVPLYLHATESTTYPDGTVITVYNTPAMT